MNNKVVFLVLTLVFFVGACAVDQDPDIEIADPWARVVIMSGGQGDGEG